MTTYKMPSQDLTASEPNEISEPTRRNLFDAIRVSGLPWYGRLDDVEFLYRVFDLNSMPSTDSRHPTMAGDISRHRFMNSDWDEDWVFSDRRLRLLNGPDETLLRFLCEMVHPVVRESEDEVDKLVKTFNRYLAADGYQISTVDYMSGKRLFAAAKTLPGIDGGISAARKIADELSSGHLSAQITRMQANIEADPALAIGTSKEFVESICKAILDARGVPRTGREEFPQLASTVRDLLGLKVNPKADVTVRSLLGALGTITNSIAELRGQLGTGHGGAPDSDRPPVAIARLAVGVATAFGVFVWEAHRAAGLAMSD